MMRTSFLNVGLKLFVGVAVALVFTGCGGGDGGTPASTSNTPASNAIVNSAPLANAGVDQSVTIGTPVTLDGTASSDANGDTLTYSWSLESVPAGSSATLASPTSAKPVFTADLDGAYVVRLVVNDGAADSVADTVAITVLPSNALILDGVDDRAEANATVFPSSATAASFTVEAWIYPTTAGTVIAADDAYDLILFQNSSEPRNSGIGIKFSLFTTCIASVDDVEFRDVTLNHWNHVAAMYSAEQGQIWLAINGVISPTPTPVVTSTLCSDQIYNFTVGGFYNSSISTFAGKIDDVRVSRGARYNTGFASLPLLKADPDTVTLWSFNEALGATTFTGSGTSALQLKAIANAQLGAE